MFRGRCATDLDTVDIERQCDKRCFGQMQRLPHVLSFDLELLLKTFRLMPARIGEVFEESDPIGLHGLARTMSVWQDHYRGRRAPRVDLD